MKLFKRPLDQCPSFVCMPGADAYFTDGCGRCEYGGTPKCKVHLWERELQLLRELVLSCGLEETRKWGSPCYTFQGKNAVMLGAFKQNCVISFLQGHLLGDPRGLLELPGPNSREGRVLRFTESESIEKEAEYIRHLIKETCKHMASGTKKSLGAHEEILPEELSAWFVEDQNFKAAFYALTPGRRRGYLIHFSQPAQSSTRIRRIEKNIARIMAGKGLQDP